MGNTFIPRKSFPENTDLAAYYYQTFWQFRLLRTLVGVTTICHPTPSNSTEVEELSQIVSILLYWLDPQLEVLVVRRAPG